MQGMVYVLVKTPFTRHLAKFSPDKFLYTDTNMCPHRLSVYTARINSFGFCLADFGFDRALLGTLFTNCFRAHRLKSTISASLFQVN